AVTTAAFHPRSPRIAVPKDDGMLHMLELPAMTRVMDPWPLAGKEPSRAIAFSPDGTFVAAGKGIVTVWDVASGRAVGKPIPGHMAQFDRDGKCVLLRDGSAWDWATARAVFRPPRPHQVIGPPSFSPDGKFVLINHTETFWRAAPDIRVYEIATGRSVSGQLG